MKNSYGSGLVYQTDEGTLSIYDMYVKNQVVFHVVVDNADPKLTIQIAKPGETTRTMTRGRATKYEFIVRDEDGDARGIGIRVDSASIQSYVYSRLVEILAKLYVPILDPNVTVRPAACHVVPDVSRSRSSSTTSVQPMCAR